MTGTSLLPLSTLAGTIKAHIAAGDKSIGKAEEHYKAAGLHLMEAKDRVKRTANLTWPAFLLGECGIQARRANELIEIADGRKTLTEVREKKAKSQAATMAKYRSGTTGAQSSEKVQQDQSTPLVEDGQGEIERLKEQLAAANAEVERLTEENTVLKDRVEVSALEIACLRAENDRLRDDEDSRSDWLVASDLIASDSGRSTDEIIRTEFAIEFRQTMVFKGYDDEPEAQQPESHLTYVDFQAAGALLGQCAAKNVIKKIRDRQPPDKAALAALRKRAQALGYKTIHRRGNDYWIVNADGERTQGGTGLDLMAEFLDDEEAFRAGAVRVYSTHCGKPVSAHDVNGEVALDDPRAVEAFARFAA